MPDLGIVRFSMRRNATRITGRWDNGKVLVIMPPDVDGQILADVVKSMMPGLLAHRPVMMFEIGQTLELDGGVTFQLDRHHAHGTDIDVVRTSTGFMVRVGRDVDMNAAETPGRISRLMIRAAGFVAEDLLIPRAGEIASRLGLTPRCFKISRGHRVLGHCSAKGEIALSSLCLFLPWDLRDYVICHELAHLTEMNHSARFHSLCDSYLGGREAELTARLRRFKWPIER